MKLLYRPTPPSPSSAFSETGKGGIVFFAFSETGKGGIVKRQARKNKILFLLKG